MQNHILLIQNNNNQTIYHRAQNHLMLFIKKIKSGNKIYKLKF